MRHDISGTVMQTLSITLEPSESVFAQTHGILGGILGSD